MEKRNCISFPLLLMVVLSCVPIWVLSTAGTDARITSTLVPQETAVGPTAVTVNPVADSYVSESEPNANFGQAQSLQLGSGRTCYLMFTLPLLEANATISEARLRVYATSGSTSGYVNVHYCPDDSWTEGGITWSNKPTYNATRADRISPSFWTGWEHPWDVTVNVRRNYASGDPTITFVLVSGGARATYVSREGSSKPQLIIEYLTGLCFRISAESTDQMGRYDNLGSVFIGVTEMSLPGPALVKSGTYSLQYVGDYEFVRWETEGPITVANTMAESTTVEIRGSGLIRAVGKSAGVMLQSSQEGGITSNMGYIVLDDEPHFLPAEISVVKPGQHTISYEGGYTFIRWETLGDLSVSNPFQSATTINVGPGNGTIIAVGSANVMEYAYDDGSCESYQYKAEDPGSMWAVRFSPLFSGILLEARVYIAGNPAGFMIHVMDQNREDIVAPFLATPGSEGWLDVDLSSHDIRVRSREDFYIGVEWITKDSPRVGYDSQDPTDRRSWARNATSWEATSYYYDIMIRAVVETTMLESGITCQLTPGSVGYMNATTISGAVSPADQETATATVVLQYSSNGVPWLNITRVTCSASSYSYSWRTSLPVGSYQIRAVWYGSQTYFGSSSGTQQLLVVKARTTLTCRFVDQTVSTDMRVTVSGDMSPVQRATAVVLTFTYPSGFSSNRTVYTSSNGHFSTDFTPSQEGMYRVQAYWQGDENHMAAQSSASELDVVAPFPYAIAIGAVVVFGGGIVLIILLLRRRSSKPERPLPPPPPIMILAGRSS